jgi:tetratricopeptide (TPR) repeat protein
MDEADLPAVDALLSIRAEQEDWDAVTDLMQARITHTPDQMEANQHRHRLVEIYRRAKEDEDQAIEVLREILLTDPDDETAAAELSELYASTEKWFDLKEHILSRMSRHEDPAPRVHALKQLAELAEERFEDPDEAVQYLHEAHELDPMDGDVLDALERLLASTERLADLIDLLEKRVQEVAGTDPATELALLVRIGEIYNKELNDAARAVEYYERVLERDPDHALALQALADLHEQAGEWDRCIRVLDQAANSTDDTTVMGEIFYRIGTIKRDRLDDMNGALESFNAVLEVHPEHPEILGTLKDYFAAEEDWGRYASILEVQERTTEDPEDKLEVLHELASVMRDRLGAPEQALGYLEQANSLKPGDVDVLGALVDAYIASDRTADAIPMLEDLIEAERERSGKRSRQLAVYHHQLGQAYHKQGDVERAVEEFERANAIDMTNFNVNFSLGKLYMEQGRTDEAMKMLRPLLLQNLADSHIDKADVYYFLGRLHSEKGEKPKALSMLERGLAQNRDHEGIKTLLDELKG